MKYRGNHSILYFVASLHLLLIFLLILPLSPVSGHAQDISAPEIWCLGDCNGLAMEFDECPGIDEIHYMIPDKAPVDVKFPAGVVYDSSSYEAGCLPSKISLYFSLEKNYADLTLSIPLNGWGEFSIYSDSLPLDKKIMFYAPYGWRKEEITWPYLSSGKHNLVLEATGNDSHVYFDYIKLQGFMDTDKDGIIDLKEGDLDSDGDGISDWEDADCATIPIPLSFPYDGTLFLTIKSPESCQDSNCLFIETVTFFDILSIHDPNRNLPKAPEGQAFTYGIFSVTLKGLPEGGPVMFTIITPSPFHGIEKVWAEDFDHSWRPILYDHVDNKMDFIISDGDFCYRDGEANGKITVSFALTIPVRLPPYAQESCFISSLNGKGNLFRSCL